MDSGDAGSLLWMKMEAAGWLTLEIGSAMLLEELLDSGFRVEDAERLRDLLTVGCRNSAIEELKEKRESLLRSLHEKESSIDCIDSVLYKIRRGEL